MDPVGKEILNDQIEEKAEDIAIDLGVLEALHLKPQDQLTGEEQNPKEFWKKATGKLHIFKDFLDEFLKTIERTRAKSDHERAMRVLMKHFQAAEQVDWDKAESFLNKVGALENVKTPTVRKWRSTYVKFWGWLNLNSNL